MNKNLLGVVVCGGQSKRMGSDKGLILKNNKPWALLVAQKFENLGIPYCVSIHEGQLSAYQTIFKEEVLVVDNQNLGGPMNGLLSVHHQHPHLDLFLLACDMIDMEEGVIADLVRIYESNSLFDYYAYDVGGVVQPFCAVYTAKAISELIKQHHQDALSTSSLRYTIENGNTLKQTINLAAPFTNYNTLDERKK